MSAMIRAVSSRAFSSGALLVAFLGPALAEAATSTSFSPTTVTLARGASTTITVSTVGVPYDPQQYPTTIQANLVLNLAADYAVSSVSCAGGIFAGADPTPDPISGGSIGCRFPDWQTGVSGPTGEVLTFVLTRGATGAAGVAVTMDETSSGYLVNNESGDGVGTTNSVTILDPPPDLTIAKSHVGSFTQGQTGATYSIVVTNGGTGPTSGTVTVTDTLPAGLTATAIAGTGWSCTLATLTCTRSDVLAVSSSYPAITLTVNVAANAPASVVNSVTVSGGGELNTSNNTATDPATIVQLADLTIAKSHVGSFTQGQTGATYSIVVTNGGTGPTSGTVTVTDTLPAGLTATAIAGTGWSCTLATLTCTRSDVLAVSSSYPAITLTVNVAANAPASVVNSVTVSGGGELNTSNNTATDPATIVQLADLTIAKSHVGSFTQGQTGATYSIVVTNGGTGPTSGTATVTDTLPTGLTATAIAGTGWSCTLATLTCTRSDVLAVSSSYPAITLTVNVAANAPASVVNSVAVSGGGELNTSNNTATDPATIVPVADLTVAKSHAGSFTQGRRGRVLDRDEQGRGPDLRDGDGADTLPTGLTATAIAGTGWSWRLATLTCTRSDVLAVSVELPGDHADGERAPPRPRRASSRTP